MATVLKDVPSAESHAQAVSEHQAVLGPETTAVSTEPGLGSAPVYDRGGRGAAFLVSFVFHVTLLLVLALCVYTAGRPSKGILLTANVDDSLATDFELTSEFSGSPEDAASELIPEVEEPEVSVDVEISDLLSRLDGSADGVQASLASLDAKSIADGLETRGKGASFFGAYAEGNRFVYVLDSSNSMRGERWTYACNKLVDSIQALAPHQEFFVVCFDARTTYLYGVARERAKYLPADEDAPTRVKRWLRSKNSRLGPSTRPAEALEFALEFAPDAIFLLSDGELKDNSRGMLRVLNGPEQQYRRIPVHTISLFSNRGRATLEAIAAENLGTFTPVTGR